MVERLKLAQNIVDEIKFERVHRMGNRNTGRSGGVTEGRNIVAKFSLFKDREAVKRQRGKISKGRTFPSMNSFRVRLASGERNCYRSYERQKRTIRRHGSVMTLST